MSARLYPAARLDPEWLSGRAGPLYLTTGEMQRVAQAVVFADRYCTFEIESYAERIHGFDRRHYRLRPAYHADIEQQDDIRRAADWLLFRGLADMARDGDGSEYLVLKGPKS